MRIRALALAAVIATAASPALAARGDRSRDRALGDAVVVALVKGPASSRHANTKLLPIVPTRDHGLQALEPGQGRHVNQYRVTSEHGHHIAARGVSPLLDHLAPRQRDRVSALAAAGGGTITWSSRVLPIIHFMGERRETHIGKLPRSLRARHTLTVAADGALDYQYAVHDGR